VHPYIHTSTRYGTSEGDAGGHGSFFKMMLTSLTGLDVLILLLLVQDELKRLTIEDPWWMRLRFRGTERTGKCLCGVPLLRELASKHLTHLLLASLWITAIQTTVFASSHRIFSARLPSQPTSQRPHREEAWWFALHCKTVVTMASLDDGTPLNARASSKVHHKTSPLDQGLSGTERTKPW